MTIIGRPTYSVMSTAHKICGIFSTSFNFRPATYFVSHCCGRALQAVFHERFSLKSRVELFDYGVETVMSKVTHVMICMVLTQCFASLVCFGSFKNLILSGFARGWCHFTSKRLLYTSI